MNEIKDAIKKLREAITELEKRNAIKAIIQAILAILPGAWPFFPGYTNWEFDVDEAVDNGDLAEMLAWADAVDAIVQETGN